MDANNREFPDLLHTPISSPAQHCNHIKRGEWSNTESISCWDFPPVLSVGSVANLGKKNGRPCFIASAQQLDIAAAATSLERWLGMFVDNWWRTCWHIF